MGREYGKRQRREVQQKQGTGEKTKNNTRENKKKWHEREGKGQVKIRKGMIWQDIGVCRYGEEYTV